jgi:amidase
MPLKVALGCFLALVAAPLLAQTDRPIGISKSLTGRWIVTADMHGTPVYFAMDIEQEGERISGIFDGQPLQGSLKGGSLHFLAQNDSEAKTVDAILKGGMLSGKMIDTYKSEMERPEQYTFTATLVPARRPVVPQRHEFSPSVFYREFSPLNKPVLTVSAGDTIHTRTIDAAGMDETGQRRSMGGNPQTGPFYIESAMPGDTLVVHLTRLRLNRDSALSNDVIVARGLESALAVYMKDVGKTVRWRLDLTRGLASLEKPGEHTGQYTIPVHPMLGCIATAPPPTHAAPDTSDSGNFGGNMDFNEVVEGATVYLPVFVPGALLYIGDGHAVQGDGELNGNALETSLDIEFTVDLIPRRQTPAPRVESTTYIVAVGLGGSLDDAFRNATTNMAHWLYEDYKLTPSELGEVLGPAAEYKVSEVADRNASIVLKIRKELLKNVQ